MWLFVLIMNMSEMDNQERQVVSLTDLVDQLRNVEDPELRLAIAEKIGMVARQKSSDLAPLLEAIDDRDPAIRSLAILATSKVGSPAFPAVATLAAHLKDSEEGIRALAASALGNIGSEAFSAVQDLVECLNDPEFEVRAGAVEALGKIGQSAKPAIPALLAEMLDEDLMYRLVTARSLLEIDPDQPRALSELKYSLEGDNKYVHLEALSVLDGMPDIPLTLIYLIEQDRASEDHMIRTIATRILQARSGRE